MKHLECTNSTTQCVSGAVEHRKQSTVGDRVSEALFVCNRSHILIGVGMPRLQDWLAKAAQSEVSCCANSSQVMLRAILLVDNVSEVLCCAQLIICVL